MEKTFSEKEILDMAVEIQPILDKIAEFTKKNGIEGFVAFTAWNDGTIFLNGTGMCGWRITREPEGLIEIDYSYTKKVSMEGENKNE